MNHPFINSVTILLLSTLSLISAQKYGNLSCYQCTRHKEAECDPIELKPCNSTYDRCVTHITKSAQSNLTITRGCGLAPCQFDDDMVKKGLGMTCDRSKKSFFCIFCCKENGCNKGSNASRIYATLVHWLPLFIVYYFC